ncbi:O-antigen ligase family protein [Geoalkalibacter halelectricus]|uniref:O-antigen ligase family protein n=1 Tax=Geoalkalibacter halelectricus TaxID=2847045 RepID=A0ABY5ZQA3_9BACT|nr:O-antigen ligase family protein [Geoalkalibacter halelectricus]MDO3376776.1 O-antigen ligase family protein [Geoalkalibacter halelectricus]UWZ81273.1 O-antigen ligase family protein [Geoalkalibacter halelectricus]
MKKLDLAAFFSFLLASQFLTLTLFGGTSGINRFFLFVFISCFCLFSFFGFNGEFKINRLVIIPPLSIFFLYFSSLKSLVPFESFLFLGIFIGLSVLVLFSTHLEKSLGGFFDNCVCFLLVTGTIAASLGLFQYLWFIAFGPKIQVLIPNILLSVGSPRITGMYGQPNLFALFLSLVFLCYSYRYLHCDLQSGRLNRGHVWLRLIPVALVAFAFFQTGSRNGLLAMALVSLLVVYFIAKRRYLNKPEQFRERLLPLLGGVFVGYLVYRLLALGNVTTRSLVGVSDMSIDTRFVLWGSSLLMGFERPLLGVGFSNFNYFLADTQIIAQEKLRFLYESRSYTNWSHNEYLQMFAEGGVPAFLLFTGLALYILKRLIVGVVREGRGNDPAFVYSHLMLLPFFFMAFFSWPFRFAPLLALFAVILGCALSHGPTITWRPSRVTRFTFQGLAVCACALTVFLMTLDVKAASLRDALREGQSVEESFTDFQHLAYNPQTRYVALTRILPEMTRQVLEARDKTLALRLIPFAEDLAEMERAYWQWLLLSRLYFAAGLLEQAREAAEMAIHQQPVHEPAWQFLHYIDMTRAARDTGRPIESFFPGAVPTDHLLLENDHGGNRTAQPE